MINVTIAGGLTFQNVTLMSFVDNNVVIHVQANKEEWRNRRTRS